MMSKDIQHFVLVSLFATVFLLIVGIVTVATRADDVLGGGSGIASTSVTVANGAPVVASINFATAAFGSDTLSSSGVLPNLGANRTIHITGVVLDSNGEDDIASVGATFYRTGVLGAEACSSDKNSCYHVATTSCSLSLAYGDDTEAAYDCPVTIAFWTDATDAGGRFPTKDWSAHVAVTDDVGSTGELVDTVEVNSLLALNIPDSINYGTRSLGEESTATSDVEMILTQRGNTSLDIGVYGTAMPCSVIGQIPVSSQGWSLTSVDFGDAVPLTGSSADTNRNIGYRDDDLFDATSSLFWSIGVPVSGVKGLCTGANTVSIVANPMPDPGSGSTEAPPQRLATVSFDRTYYIPASSDIYSWGVFVNNTSPFEFLASSSPVYWTDVDGSSDGNTFGYATYAVDSTGGLHSAVGFGGSGGELTSLTLRGDISNVAMVRAGDLGSVFAVKTDGTLWAQGANSTGQLCLGDTTDRTNFTQVGSDTNWAWVETGNGHTVAIKTDGTLWTCGQNDVGQLGIGNTTDQTSLVQVGSATDWKYVFAGSGMFPGNDYTIAITTGGTMFAWGYNNQGQLGLGDTANRTSPVQVGTDSNWRYAATGYEHTLALKTTGTLWSWGDDTDGKLGLGGIGNQTSPTQVGSASDWFNITASRRNSFAYKTTSTSTYFGWGTNSNNALGVETFPDNGFNVPTEILIRQ